MNLHWADIIVFVVFFAVVVGVSMFKSRKERSGEDFFLAGRSLVWPLIGFSLIAANISTEHFVGQSGQGAGAAGFAIASYEWMAGHHPCRRRALLPSQISQGRNLYDSRIPGIPLHSRRPGD